MKEAQAEMKRAAEQMKKAAQRMAAAQKKLVRLGVDQKGEFRFEFNFDTDGKQLKIKKGPDQPGKPGEAPDANFFPPMAPKAPIAAGEP